MPAKMIRCPEGHFFDSEKHTACPWCAPQVVVADVAEPDKTRKLDVPGDASASPPTAPLGGVTKRLDLTEAGTRPVVGWLVCVEGPDKGKDYRLHSEKNFIGREPGMDILIAGDASVSRRKHAILTFDPKKRNFWLQPGESESLVYLNEELVNAPVLLAPYQIVEVGKSRLVLVPFDTEKFPL